MADGTRAQLPEQPGVGRLGRHVWHDPRNRAWPARGVTFAETARPRPIRWWRRTVFDQGNESSCTAQAAAGLLMTSPLRMKLDRANLTSYDGDDERRELYDRARENDPWVGENYDGSSTDAPFRVLRARGQIREWRWIFGVDELVRALPEGPVAVGTNWHADMDHPRGSRAVVTATGPLRGGHAYDVIGLEMRDPAQLVEERDLLVCVNSWGFGWANRGRFTMTVATMRKLLEAQGEAVMVVL